MKISNFTVVMILFIAYSCSTAPKQKRAAQKYWKPHPQNFQIIHLDKIKNPWKIIKDNSLVNTELDQITPEFMHESKRRGVRVVAYFSASFEKWRADAPKYPKKAKGKKMGDWDELWGDISKKELRDFLEIRMKKAKALGVDGIEIDNTDIAYNEVGFKVSPEENLQALIDLASRAHKHGLAIFLKNTGDLAQELAKHFDGVFSESPIRYNEYDDFLPFINKGRPVYIIEYQRRFCTPVAGAVVQLKKDYFSTNYKICE
ncbi:MAG: endo alpha-1,4 polygalactosaminidase [Bacteriovoracaceae bacterium]|jgi:endo-alpha-1,4-polygalactosaminidase (GH114 family)|nr:endo alpha-1,4 polygalactosaminidase [Bacteriovoracaceae bacterium]